MRLGDRSEEEGERMTRQRTSGSRNSQSQMIQGERGTLKSNFACGYLVTDEQVGKRCLNK